MIEQTDRHHQMKHCCLHTQLWPPLICGSIFFSPLAPAFQHESWSVTFFLVESPDHCERQTPAAPTTRWDIKTNSKGSCALYRKLLQKYLSGDEDLLQQSVVILLKGVQLSLSLGLGTQLSVLDHLGIKVTIWVEIMRVMIRHQKFTQHDLVVCW